MAQNDKGPAGPAGGGSSGGPGGGGDAAKPPEDRLMSVLESRWDPGKMSAVMRGSTASSGRRLDMSQRSRFEKRLGTDLGNVRIFSGELAEEIVSAHGAEALTIGDTGMILMRNSTQYAPGTAAGTALLAHELTHVAQANPSKVSLKSPKQDMANKELSEQEAEEHEAEVHAEEKGAEPAWKTQATKDESERARFERIRDKVMELMEEMHWMESLRGNDFGGR